jgi:hypothetical protein
MGKKTQLPTKHIRKKVNEQQHKEIEKLTKDGTIPWAIAKHEFFEAQEKQTTKEILAAHKDKPKKSTMKIGETKLGVTMVINKEECKKLGFPESMTTKEAIKGIRGMLKLEA